MFVNQFPFGSSLPPLKVGEPEYFLDWPIKGDAGGGVGFFFQGVMALLVLPHADFVELFIFVQIEGPLGVVSSENGLSFQPSAEPLLTANAMQKTLTTIGVIQFFIFAPSLD